MAVVTVVVLVGGMFVTAAGAATINVPGDYATIQSGMDHAVIGDTVVVAPGTYHERIHFTGGKTITVRSTNPNDPAVVAATIIDGDSGGRVVWFEASDATLSGFTITHGGSSDLGGGVYAASGAPTISNNVITANTATTGGGLRLDGGTPSIIQNVISGNTSQQAAGLCLIDPIDGVVRGNVISGNTCPAGDNHYAGGAFVSGTCALTNNTITGNQAPYAGGVQVARNGTATLIGNIIAFNTGSSPNSGGGIYLLDGNTAILSYCDVYGNTGGNCVGMTDPVGSNGNLSVDPRFANAAANDFRLKSAGGRWNGSVWVTDAVTSVCIDAGDPAATFSAEPTPNGGRVNMGFDGNTAHASKTPAPVITVCTPKGTGIPTSAKITVSFSVPMLPAAVKSAFFINGVQVTTGTFTWLGTKLTYAPVLNWKPNKHYQVKITTVAKSKAGVRMAADKIWTFTTGAISPAMVTAAAAATGSGAQITLNLAAAADVTVSIRNLAGRSVALLQPGQMEAGVQTLVWNGKSGAGTKVPAGTYLLEATAHNSDGTSAKAVASLMLH